MKKFLNDCKESLKKFTYIEDNESMREVKEKEYYDDLMKNPTKREKAFDKAWQIRDFEIELYWKRATYFWAFQVASFTAYFAILNSDSYKHIPPNSPQVLYFICCIGLLTSIAWTLINKGSKEWQKNWEYHIDMLEDTITGPLYKTVHPKKTYSVSKINVIVSKFFTFIWFLLLNKYLFNHITLCSENALHFDWLVFLASCGLLYFIFIMFNGYGRGRFGERTFEFYRRVYKQSKK